MLIILNKLIHAHILLIYPRKYQLYHPQFNVATNFPPHITIFLTIITLLISFLFSLYYCCHRLPLALIWFKKSTDKEKQNTSHETKKNQITANKEK